MKKTRQEKGITLIALIITIVVLLILAVVAIRAVQGDGIIQYARNARNDYEQAQANEQAQLQNYLDILDENNSKGDTTAAPIVHNGIIPEGAVYLTEVTWDSEAESCWSYTVKLKSGDKFPDTVKKYDTYIYDDYVYMYQGVFDPYQPYFSIQVDDYQIKGFNGSDNDTTDWCVGVIDNTKSSYGSILASINDKPITSIESTFCTCTNLIDASNIIIPSTVIDMDISFMSCDKLTIAPEIPSSVKRMHTTFGHCSSLTTTPAIPSSVENMEWTFMNCTSLTGKIEINANPSEYDNCFLNVDFTAQNLTLTGSSNMLATLGATGSNYQG